MMSGDLELLRRRFFPTEEDKNRNRTLLGCLPPQEGINQWTGKNVVEEEVERKDKEKERKKADVLAYLELCKKTAGAY